LRVVANDRSRLQHVERFALWQALHDVDQHDVGITALGKPLREGGADVARADNRDLRATHPHATVANPPPPSLHSISEPRCGKASVLINARERRFLRTLHESAVRTHMSWRSMLVLSSFWFAIAYVMQPLGGTIIPLLVGRFTDPMTIHLGPLAIAADVNTY